jgi:hypothetical protein
MTVPGTCASSGDAAKAPPDSLLAEVANFVHPDPLTDAPRGNPH